MYQLSSNTLALQAILDTVNSLPESGSGGGAVETCSLTLSDDGGYGSVYYSASALSADGAIEVAYGEIDKTINLQVVCGSPVTLYDMKNGYYGGSIAVENLNLLIHSGESEVYQVPSEAGYACSIRIYI